MNSYRRAIYRLIFSTVVFAIISIVQAYIQIYYELVPLVIFFFTLGAFFLTMGTMLILDLQKKDFKLMRVMVTEVEADGEIIRVRKPNGRYRRIHLDDPNIRNLHLNDEVDLTLTRRTGLIWELRRTENSNTR